MILIYEERAKRFIDFKILQRQITGYIKDYRKEIDDEKDPYKQSINLDETLDLIAVCETELEDVKEMQKVPFDVLIVVQEENEPSIDCTDIDMNKRVIIE